MIQDVQDFLSSGVSEFATTMSVNGSALESLYNTVSDFRGPSLEDIQANNTRPEMRMIMDLASQQRVAGTSLMDDGVVDWIMLLDRTGLSTGVIHLATVSSIMFSKSCSQAVILCTFALDITSDPSDKPCANCGNGGTWQHHVEVLFVLCALCGGKKREQVQNQLAKLGLVGVLTHMFDKLDWKASQPRSSSRGIHGIGCACNPKSVSWV